MNTDIRRHLFPPPETGVHSWLFGCAAALRRVGLDEFAALSELSTHVARSTFRADRSVTLREITEAVESVYRESRALTSRPPHGIRTDGGTSGDYNKDSGWPTEMSVPNAKLDRDRLNRVLNDAGNFELLDLWEPAPVRPPDGPAPRFALENLFDLNDLLCIGSSMASFEARPLRDWTDAELMTGEFIAPNPLRKPEGVNKSGETSAHCRDATGPRRYIIVESDAGLDHDQQAKIIQHLRTEANGALAAVVMSGGKSLHAWLRVDHRCPKRLAGWFAYACSLGADPRLWLPEQFCRLPDGRRGNGKRQTVLFLDPNPL